MQRQKVSDNTEVYRSLQNCVLRIIILALEFGDLFWTMENLWSCDRGNLENFLFTEDIMNKRQIFYIAENLII
jgi:hypothetical protein